MVRRLAAALSLAFAAAACSPTTPPSERTPAPRPDAPSKPSPPRTSPTRPPDPVALSRIDVRVRGIAKMEQPVAMAIRHGDEALYIAQKTGLVVAIRGGSVDRQPVLDLRGQVSLRTEQGLLGLAFSPDGRFVYVNYTDLNGDTRVVEYAMGRRRAEEGSRREVLVVDQPFSNHNGGNLVFGPDGSLYIGLGDGGSGGDPHGNAQDLGTLLGKMLRIDPRPAGGAPYRVPGDNPFAGRRGARAEIWAYGLRNPWRYSFDRQTGDLWIGDVGQNAWEEIDFQPAGSDGGENYGWNLREGRHAFAGSAPGAVDPVVEYPLSGGNCAVTGGYVYRGRRIPGLFGAYLFADVCVGEIMAVRLANGRVVQRASIGPVVPNLVSFGEDHDGELYVLSLSGRVYRIVP